MAHGKGYGTATGVLVKRLLKECVRPYLSWVFIALLFMAIAAACQATLAWLMEPVLDDIFIAGHQDLLVIVGGAVLGTFVFKGLATYIQASLMAMLGLRVIADMQNRLYGHVLNMDLPFFHDVSTAKLISRFTNDANLIRAAVSNALTSFGKDLLTLIFLIGVMFYQNWELGLIAFFVFPMALLPVIRLGRRMRKATANTQVQMGEFMTVLEQTFQGIRHVKSYVMESYEKSRIKHVTEEIFRINLKAQRTRAMASPIMEVIGGVAITVVIVYGGYQVIQGTTTPGEFFSFITATLMAYEPGKRLANLNVSLQEGLAGADRLFNILDMRAGITQKPEAVSLDMARGAIELRDVSFDYADGTQALEGCSIAAPVGHTIALVGPSGAGKSTILNMIPRFYDVKSGQVLIDGHDIRDLSFDSLRRHIALVSQEIGLFDNTVRANIAYGREDASEEDIIQAAKNAAAHDFILELPEGYDTVIGEQGVKLSGGQRQRLSIARAMVKNAPILLLDEATSALDTESERKVQSALKGLMSDRTTLVIAHRLSTVVDADMIYVIEGGRVQESGTHQELLDRDGTYARLYALQFAEEENAPA